ncbi:mechanosensitive ion channel family protein [Legionella cardiaca]|uniref:Mechanosensitive ion channel n=1 Tax=Legionella cardiaca TaxID=1071983 RepID=A0ABY8ASL4_9GAMM|nr:mechanosensitive ion channel domain-containing protein [Legionella cardiaca]WED43650.1 mechanosensitive ion channel [Legionella cardiaca]
MNRIMLSATLIVLVFFTSALSASAFQAYSGFDVQKATRQLETIREQLSTKSPSYEQLYTAVKQITVLQKQANRCMENGKGQLQKINELLGNSEISSTLMKQNDTRYQELLHDKEIMTKVTADCALFNYHAQEILNDINAQLANTRMFNLLTKSTPVWKNFDPQSFFKVVINKDKFYQISGIDKLSKLNLIIIGFIVAIGFVFSLIFHKFLTRFSKKNAKKSSRKKWLLSLSKSGLFLLLTFLVINIYLHAQFMDVLPRPSLLSLANIFVYFMLAITITRFILSYMQQQYVTDWQKKLVADTKKRATVFLMVLWLGSFAGVMVQGQWLPPEILRPRFVIFSALLTLAFSWLSWLVFRFPFFKSLPKYSLNLIKVFLVLLFLFTVLMGLLGYSNFAVYFIPNMIATFIIFIIAWKVSELLGNLFSLLNDEGRPIAEKIHAWLGIKSTQKLTELFTIRIILNIGFLIFCVFIIMKLWGMSQYHFDYLKTWYFQGGTIYGFSIWPARIVRGAITFCVLLMVGRALSTYVTQHSAFKGEKYRQDNIAILINYTMFSIAVIVALLVAGVNFTNLAVIAGALSIGIGFGLQHLASDFVSGIILLVHKPVTPGDRVIIDDTEGYVKRIRLLSTQITTLNHADMIIPNSHLINKSVTNYNYRQNKICRVNNQVILDSGSDLALAEQILLDVVKENPYIVQTPPHHPVVSYELVPAKDSLHVIVDLWYYIKNIELKQTISSEVSFNIIRALKNNNLCPGYRNELTKK